MKDKRIEKLVDDYKKNYPNDIITIAGDGKTIVHEIDWSEFADYLYKNYTTKT